MASPTHESEAINRAQTRAAIVTVSYGSETVLSGFLDSVRMSSTPAVRVVIADNKSEESVHALAKTFHAQYLPLPENRGYGGAVNAAVDTLPDSIQWILVSNPDITLDSAALELLVAAGSADNRIGAIGPRILTAEGDVYPSARAIPSLRTGVGHALFANVWPSNPWTRSYRNGTAGLPQQRDTGWLSGACLLVRRDVFEALDGFDTDYFMYFEDVDLGYRIGKAGFRNVYDPEAVVVHTGAHSTSGSDTAAAMIRAHHDSAKLFLSRKYPGPLLAPVRWALSLGLSVRSRAASRQPRP